MPRVFMSVLMTVLILAALVSGVRIAFHTTQIQQATETCLQIPDCAGVLTDK